MFKFPINTKIKIFKNKNKMIFKTKNGLINIIIINFFLLKNKQFFNKSFKLNYYYFYYLYKGLLLLYMDFLELYGLGYKILINSCLFKLKLGLSHFIFIELYKKIKILFIKSTKILFKSIFKSQLYLFVPFIYSFKLPNRYKKKGFFLNKNYNLLKIGKTFLI